jgi:hypothetical protein
MTVFRYEEIAAENICKGAERWLGLTEKTRHVDYFTLIGEDFLSMTETEKR